MRTSTKMTLGGLIMGIIGVVIAIEFLAVDSILFNYSAPPIIQHLSEAIPLNGLDLDILFSTDLLLVFFEFKWQGEKGAEKWIS